MSRQAPSTALRIVLQYFRRDVRVYELECEGASLGLHISRDGPSAEGAWRVEAHGAGGEIVATESGTTRAGALLAVGDAWAAKAPRLGLHVFDWTAVATALRTVRAIE